MRAARIVLTVAALAVGIGVGWIAATRWAVRGHDASGTAPAGTVTATAPPAGERRVLYWYDPMVPTQKFDKPGKSPFMDMQLVPRYADEVESAAGADATSGLTVSTQAQQALGLRTAKVERRSVGATTEAVGTVQLSERDISIVQARTAGFVERTYGRAPGDVIAAGAPLVDLLTDAPKAGAGAVWFLSGPEGGLTATEEHAALQAGWMPVTLGPRTLRAETAPLAALAVVSAC